MGTKAREIGADFNFQHQRPAGKIDKYTGPHAMAGGGLMLAYGDLDAVNARKAEVGTMIRSQLEKAGFKVEWDGNPATRIAIPQLDWKRRTAA